MCGTNMEVRSRDLRMGQWPSFKNLDSVEASFYLNFSKFPSRADSGATQNVLFYVRTLRFT